VAGFVVALLFLTASLTAQQPLSREGSQSSGQSFAISEQGTLLELFDANGKSCFDKISADGFAVSYEVRGKTMAVSAIGTKSKGLQVGKLEMNGLSATATVMTKENRLEVTSNFLLDKNRQELIIERRIRNVSQDSLSLKTVRNYIASVLVSGGDSGGIRAGIYGPGSDCGGSGECTPPPCPARGCLPLIRGETNFILEWKEGIRLAAAAQRSHAGATRLQENEALIVIHVSLK